MNTYDVTCPVCGTVNHNLYLEETDGWMECENCGNPTKFHWKVQIKEPLPAFVIQKLQALSMPAEWYTLFQKGAISVQHQQTSWRLKQIYCPNCRYLVNGFEDKDGITRTSCVKCGSILIRKALSRRHDRIDLYAPRGQERMWQQNKIGITTEWLRWNRLRKSISRSYAMIIGQLNQIYMRGCRQDGIPMAMGSLPCRQPLLFRQGFRTTKYRKPDMH